MDATQTRTVAEVMDWHDDGPPGAVRQYWPDVDDMLAWLRAQGYGVVATMLQDNGGAVFAHLTTEDGITTHEAPTLHAALEQAVLAVGRAGIEPASDAL